MGTCRSRTPCVPLYVHLHRVGDKQQRRTPELDPSFWSLLLSWESAAPPRAPPSGAARYCKKTWTGDVMGQGDQHKGERVGGRALNEQGAVCTRAEARPCTHTTASTVEQVTVPRASDRAHRLGDLRLREGQAQVRIPLLRFLAWDHLHEAVSPSVTLFFAEEIW